MTAKSYSAPWGRRVWLITGSCLLAPVLLAILLPWLLDKPEARAWAWIPPAALAAVFGVTALFSVRGFEITDEAILVRRSFWRNRIPLAGLESAEVDPRACEGAWKTAGNDGLFAIHGWFRSKRLGKFQAFVTNPADAVVLRGPDRTIVLSPENPRSFVNEVNRRQRRQEGRH